MKYLCIDKYGELIGEIIADSVKELRTKAVLGHLPYKFDIEYIRGNNRMYTMSDLYAGRHGVKIK